MEDLKVNWKQRDDDDDIDLLTNLSEDLNSNRFPFVHVHNCIQWWKKGQSCERILY
jgi:hypothetical protein